MVYNEGSRCINQQSYIIYLYTILLYSYGRYESYNIPTAGGITYTIFK